jgi:putative addiction module component (TIGR02574 family)
MSQTLPLPPAGFDALSVEEQIDYVQSLWDHIAARPEQVPVPDWHKQILAERLASSRANPIDGKPWEEFEHALTAELKEPNNE